MDPPYPSSRRTTPLRSNPFPEEQQMVLFCTAFHNLMMGLAKILTRARQSVLSGAIYSITPWTVGLSGPQRPGARPSVSREERFKRGSCRFDFAALNRG